LWSIRSQKGRMASGRCVSTRRAPDPATTSPSQPRVPHAGDGGSRYRSGDRRRPVQ
jgi:hypothetical protein